MSKVQSMTGFGRGEIEENGWSYSCEIKTLNSRFIETNIRMPRSFSSLEPNLIADIKSTLKRGKVDVYFDIQKTNATSDLPCIDEKVLEHYVSQLDRMHEAVMTMRPKHFTLETKHQASEFLQLPELLRNENDNKRSQDDLELQKAPMLKALQAALQQVIEYRAKEGEKLKTALADMVCQISDSRKVIEENISDLRAFVHDTYTARLEKIVKDLEKSNQNLHLPPEERIIAEVSYLAEKADIEEEIIRIKAHEDEFMKTLNQGGEVGRKLDFLCQEFHREVNTISSKLQPTEISEHTLKMKQTIERIRQQVQNIE